MYNRPEWYCCTRSIYKQMDTVNMSKLLQQTANSAIGITLGNGGRIAYYHMVHQKCKSADNGGEGGVKGEDHQQRIPYVNPVSRGLWPHPLAPLQAVLSGSLFFRRQPNVQRRGNSIVANSTSNQSRARKIWIQKGSRNNVRSYVYITVQSAKIS